MEYLSNKIRRLRFDNGEMTQKALAEQVGISRQTMNAIENARHAPTVSVAIRIARVFGTSVEDVFELDSGCEPARVEDVETDQAAVQPLAFEVPVDAGEVVSKTEQPSADREVGLADLRNVF